MIPTEIPICSPHLTRSTTAIQQFKHSTFFSHHDTHHEGTTAGVSLPDGEAEPHHRRDRRHVQRSPARIVPDSVEDQQAGIVSRVDHWADLNGQVDGGRATNHGDIGVF